MCKVLSGCLWWEPLLERAGLEHAQHPKVFSWTRLMKSIFPTCLWKEASGKVNWNREVKCVSVLDYNHLWGVQSVRGGKMFRWRKRQAPRQEGWRSTPEKARRSPRAWRPQDQESLEVWLGDLSGKGTQPGFLGVQAVKGRAAKQAHRQASQRPECQLESNSRFSLSAVWTLETAPGEIDTIALLRVVTF